MADSDFQNKETNFTKQFDFKDESMMSIKVVDYESLIEDRRILHALQNAGVDNWEGYEIAMEPWCDD